MEDKSYRSYKDQEDAEDQNETERLQQISVAPNFPIYVSKESSKSKKRDNSLKNYAKSRLIYKNGHANTILAKHQGVWVAYLRDISNTLVNSRWRWILSLFSSCYLLSWLIFAWCWLLIVRSNSDIEYVLDVNDTTQIRSTKCIEGIYGFAGYFLFSLETQHTIGYGTRYITSECPEGIFMVCLQVIMGSAICGAMASIVYTKMIIPRRLISKGLFSKHAIICQRDGIFSLIFRLRDEDNKHGVGTTIKAYLVQNKFKEPSLKSLKLEPCGFLLWPLEIVHKITPSSPFWNISAKDLITKHIELVATMQGVSITTGQCSKNRTSYLSSEILWGHRFKPCVKYDWEKNSYFIDHKAFNATEEVLTPLCSPKRLQEVVSEISSPISSPISYHRASVQDEVLSDYSSGIGSMRESLTSPIIFLNKEDSGNNSTKSDNCTDRDKRLSIIKELGSNESLQDDEEKNYFVDSLLKRRSRRGLVLKEDSILGGCSDWEDQISKYLIDIDEQFEDIKTKEEEGLDVERLVQNLQRYLDQTEKDIEALEEDYKESTS